MEPVMRLEPPEYVMQGMTDEELNNEIRISVEKLKKELQINSMSPWYYTILDTILDTPPEYRIFKVNHQLRQVNPKAYEPHAISIGPYHHGKEHLKAMEFDKKHCLNSILDRTEVSLDKYVEAMIKIEEKARRFYGEPVDMSRKEFAEMMLLDGCFIVTLIRLFPDSSDKKINDGGNYLFKVQLGLPGPAYDLLLLENQLPLFVVEELFKMSRMPNEKSFIDKAVSFFCGVGEPNLRKDGHSSEVKHLLDLVYQQCIPSRKSSVSQASPTGEADNDPMFQHILRTMRHGILDLVYQQCLPSRKSSVSQEIPMFQPELRTMRHAIALKEAGVKFKCKKVGQNGNGMTTLFDIEFKNGMMEIPVLNVEDNTERILRNLMAYEQFIKGPMYVCDYANFMDCLINTDEDVELLSRHGVIDNWLGDNEAVAKMFNRLCDNIGVSDESYYQEIYVGADKHCKQPWNEWMATLRHNYFNTPWALISFIAALLLLLVTIAQFITSFFSF